MSGKVKMTLVVMMLMASVSVWYLFSLFRTTGPSLRMPQQAAILNGFSYEADDDGDGLTNSQETIWRTDWRNPDTDGDGFSDGEEVLSGHDPRKPGPNDFLDPSKNLTEQASTLLWGGYFSGDIASTSTNHQLALQEVADIVFDEYQQFALAPRSLDIKVVPDSAEAIAAYLTAIQPHWVGTIPDGIRAAEDFLGLYGSADTARSRQLTENDDDNQKLVAASAALESKLRTYADELADIPVPAAMARPHQNAVALFQHMAEQAANAGALREDPVRALIANTTLAGLIERVALGFVYDYIMTYETVLATYVNVSESPAR